MSSQKPLSIRQGQKHRDKGVTLYSNILSLSSDLITSLSNLATVPESPTLKIYKRETRKAVLRLDLPEKNGGAIVIKGYPLKRLRNQIRPARFGILEAENMLKAKQLGIKTPALLGYFEFQKFGLTKANGVIMEPLDTQETLMEIAETCSDLASAAFHAAIPTIANLYQLGVNHIDISPHNIMVEKLEHPPALIDWQNCQFIAPRNERQLILQAAQFLRYIRETFPITAQKEWASDLYEATSPNLDKETFLNQVDYHTRTERPRKAFRYALDFDLSPHPNA